MTKQNEKKTKSKGKNKSIVLGIIVTLLVMVTLLGLTYAYYRTKVIGNTGEEKSINNPTKMLRVEYQDDNPEVVTDELYGPGKTLTKDFKVKNTGDDTGNYSIILDNIENTLERTWDIRYILKDKATGTELIKGTLGKELKKQMVYADIKIEADTTNEYTFELEYENPDTDQSIDMGKSLSFKIDIIEAHENIFEGQASTNTLLYAIGRDNEVVKPLTIPGTVSREDEAELSYTEDDYGTSYYFRGDVQNNYVTFASMCWRIVRVLGNGNIKLVLFDKENKCESIEEVNPDNAFVQKGSMRSSAGITLEYAKYENSKMDIALSSWYNDSPTMEGYKNYIVEAEWCNDISKVSKSSFGFSARANSPSLKCNFYSTIDGEPSIKLKSKVAGLTADEVTFAGSRGRNSSSSCLALGVGNWWWTITPYRTWSGDISFGRMEEDFTGALQDARHENTGGYRPSVVLVSSLQVNNESDGTIDNPYTIREN